MWILFYLLACLPINCRFFARMHLTKTCTAFGCYQSVQNTFNFMYSVISCFASNLMEICRSPQPWMREYPQVTYAHSSPTQSLYGKSEKRYKYINTYQFWVRMKRVGSLSIFAFWVYNVDIQHTLLQKYWHPPCLTQALLLGIQLFLRECQ